MKKTKKNDGPAPLVRDQEIRRQTLLIRGLLVNGRTAWGSWEHSIANALDEIEHLTR